MDKYIAYASGFVSFMLKDKRISKANIKEIILFGSVAREEADENSDIDIFIDVNKKNEKRIEDIIKSILPDFYNSRLYADWILRGVKNKIKVHVGVLDEWKLKRSVISNGIILFSEYKRLPEKGLEHYVLFVFKPITDIAKRNKIIRILFGRKEKTYLRKGLLDEIDGKQISARCFYVSHRFAEQIIKILNREKVDYQLFELWSDVFK